MHCSSDPFVWRFWPTDVDPRDHYSGKNYSDVAVDDGVDDGNGPAPAGAAGQDDSDSDSSSGLSLSSDDEAGGHSGTLCAPRPPAGTRPLSLPMASCAAACAAALTYRMIAAHHPRARGGVRCMRRHGPLPALHGRATTARTMRSTPSSGRARRLAVGRMANGPW